MKLVRIHGKFLIERGWIAKSYLDITEPTGFFSGDYAVCKYCMADTKEQALAALEAYKLNRRKVIRWI